MKKILGINGMAMLRCGLFMLILATAPWLAGIAAGVEQSDIDSMHEFTQTRLETARTGTSARWRNPRTGAAGTVRILSTDDRPGRPPCRTYSWSIRAVSGDSVEGRGEGCRISANRWSLDETLRKRTAKRTKPRSPNTTAKRASPGPSAPSKSKEPSKQAEAEDATTEKDPLAELTFTTPPRTFVVPDLKGAAK